MNRKILSTVLLLIILAVISISGSVYTYYFQAKDIDKNKAKLKELNTNAQDTEELQNQLAQLQSKINELDSILALRKYVIPVSISQAEFFKFINEVSSKFGEYSHVDIEYKGEVEQPYFKSYNYLLKGTADFNDLYRMIYAIEQSKELKKVLKGDLRNFVEVDKEEFPHYLVTYSLDVLVYYSDKDDFASSQYKENKLTANPLYNIFYPLIRDEIPPNSKDLLDVQTAQLLALIPDGAYVSDATGKTRLLWEGDEVYLGYLTKIDFENNEVKFVLNKGGVIEKITLELEQKNLENKKQLTSK
ncbi:MAG: hypothetical protein CR986_02560 [Ignavibacteriae bacterium]|nr:MAG: hypothetical protein CR986_02560 [Ignavibacteriota bacterium]